MERNDALSILGYLSRIQIPEQIHQDEVPMIAQCDSKDRDPLEVAHLGQTPYTSRQRKIFPRATSVTKSDQAMSMIESLRLSDITTHILAVAVLRWSVYLLGHIKTVCSCSRSAANWRVGSNARFP